MGREDAIVCLWRSEDNFMESFFFLHFYLVPRDPTWVSRFAWQGFQLVASCWPRFVSLNTDDITNHDSSFIHGFAIFELSA